jgi:hypothetical protein
VNVLSTKVALRERTLAEVFDLSFRFLVVRGGRKYLRLWLFSCAPMLALCCWLRFLKLEWLWVWAAALVGFVVAQIPFTLAASRLLLEDDLAVGAVVKAWLLKIPGQLISHGIASVLLLGSGLVIVPVPFLAGRLLFLPEVTLLEGSGFVRALERGGRMSRHRLGETLQACLLLLVIWVFFILGTDVLGRALQVDLLGFPPPADSLADGGSWYALAGFFIAVPVLATARFLAYIDGRTRREAWDVQLRFTDLAERAG